MANADRPCGFSPYGQLKRLTKYMAGGTVYPGSLVKFDSAGKVVEAAASDACCGVANSYATTGQDLWVYDDPGQLFEGQSDSADIDAQTDINLNFNFVVGTPSSTYRTSAFEVDGDTGATTATLPLKLINIVPAPTNAFGANVRCVVKINNHQLGSHTGTAGV